MAIKLSGVDHRNLDRTLEAILSAHGRGEVSLAEAQGALAHVITASAIGDEDELRAWLRPQAVSDWRNMINAHRS